MLLCLRAEACDHEAHVARLVDEIGLVRASWGARVLDWEDERGDCFSGQRRARDRGDRADRGRSGSVQEGSRFLLSRICSKPAAAEQDERARCRERDDGGGHAAGEAVSWPACLQRPC